VSVQRLSESEDSDDAENEVATVAHPVTKTLNRGCACDGGGECRGPHIKIAKA